MTEPQSFDICEIVSFLYMPRWLGHWGIFFRPVAQHVVLPASWASAGPSAGYASGKLGIAIQSGAGRRRLDDLYRLPPVDGWTSFIKDRSTKSSGATGRSRLAQHPIKKLNPSPVRISLAIANKER